jgi:hypothetical protein
VHVQADGQPAGYESSLADGNRAVLVTIHDRDGYRTYAMGVD